MRISDWSSDVCSSDLVVHTLRQQGEKAKGLAYHALSDFIAPKETGIADYFGGFAVTSGTGIEKHLEEFRENMDDYSSIMLKALADRLAEAFAECMHEKVRKELWGYASGEHLSNDELKDRKSVVKGTRVAGSVECGGRRRIKKTKK